jgi:hypothetical protein
MYMYLKPLGIKNPAWSFLLREQRNFQNDLPSLSGTLFVWWTALARVDQCRELEGFLPSVCQYDGQPNQVVFLTLPLALDQADRLCL